jgi:CRP-like cAMP-binding protein
MDMTHLAANAGGIFSSVFLVATYTMRTMIPLRIFGILTNIVLILFSIVTEHYATVVLHAVLLPLNVYRLNQMLQLVRDVRRSVHSDLSMAWLKPFMTERSCAAGDVLFYKDEKAEEMFYIVSGRFQLVELDIELPVGALVGELGMLSPDNRRTQTLECLEGGTVLGVSYQQVEELYVQNPSFGFYFLRLVSARLFQNLGRMEDDVQRLTVELAAAKRELAEATAS